MQAPPLVAGRRRAGATTAPDADDQPLTALQRTLRHGFHRW